MSRIERALTQKAQPMGAPGIRQAIANLRKRGYRPVYSLRLKNDRFEYLVQVHRVNSR